MLNSKHQESKDAIRKKILTLRRNQKEEERFKKSKIIQKKLFLTPEFRNARVILFYAACDGEVETFDMIRKSLELGKTVALPKIMKQEKKIIPLIIHDLENDLEIGPYNIRQPKDNYTRPVDLKDIDLVAVPGVAFDKDNHRLGRGAGYYDRFLKDFPDTTPKFGLAFDFQIVQQLPHPQAHDVAVTRVISD